MNTQYQLTTVIWFTASNRRLGEVDAFWCFLSVIKKGDFQNASRKIEKTWQKSGVGSPFPQAHRRQPQEPFDIKNGEEGKQ